MTRQGDTRRNFERQVASKLQPSSKHLYWVNPWPGNIRELQNIIERAVILSPGKALRVALPDLKSCATENGGTNGAVTLEEMERRHILAVLEQTNWVISGPHGAAARLGLKRPTLQFRMYKLGIARPERR